jgi:hypothetical protein
MLEESQRNLHRFSGRCVSNAPIATTRLVSLCLDHSFKNPNIGSGKNKKFFNRSPTWCVNSTLIPRKYKRQPQRY